MISLDKVKILTPLQKLPKNVRDLGKLILKSCPKSNKSPNLVTLSVNEKGKLQIKLLFTWRVSLFKELA